MPPKIKFVRVDETEYNALCDLRDVAHTRALATIDQLRASVAHESEMRVLAAKQHDTRYAGCTAVNEEQCARLAEQALTIRNLRERLAAATKRALEAERFAPATLAAAGEQPLFNKQELRKP